MPDYKTLYHYMFNKATEAIEMQQKAAELLQAAQQEGEEAFLENPPQPPLAMGKSKKTKQKK